MATLQHAIRVGVPHALHIGAEDQQAFSQIFADYELLQPFAQLGRDTYALSGAERQGTVLSRWVGVTVASGRVMGLLSRGWWRGHAQDGGGIWYFSKPVGDGRMIEQSQARASSWRPCRSSTPRRWAR
ncbi:DUF4132 domain-containing protein [Comamonas serinivorans]|nr:DUF4132 domain-containing protein [Comamonas serinivorans]